MILQEFSNFLQNYNEQLLTQKMTPLDLLPIWISKIIKKNPKNNIEKIIHREILFCENNQNEFLIVGKSDSGRKLVNSLIEFAKSYDNYIYAKWLNSTNNAYYSKNV